MSELLATDVYFTLSDGNKIPALGLGTDTNYDPSDTKEQVKTAIKAGYRNIDTAWYYGTEKAIGEALKELFDEGIVKREDIFITTKFWPSLHHNPEKSLNDSLQSLGLDYVDLLLQHYPVAFKSGEDGKPVVPRDADGNVIYEDDPVDGSKFIDAYHKLEDLLETSDKVKSIGVSNYSNPKLRKLLSAVKKHKPVVNQIEYHPQLPQKNLIDFNKKHGIHITAYTTVGGSGAPILKLPLVQELAQKYDVTTNEVANAYHILQGRSCLPRSSNLERIKKNTRLPRLTQAELDDLYQIGVQDPHRYILEPWGRGLGFKWWPGDTWSKEFD